jgi:hypothetical protein
MVTLNPLNKPSLEQIFMFMWGNNEHSTLDVISLGKGPNTGGGISGEAHTHLSIRCTQIKG